MVKEATLARTLAPEDIKVNTFVMTLHRQSQIMISKGADPNDPQVAAVPVITRPCFPELPAKVVAICLPFIVIERENKKTEIIDTRAERLAQVPKEFAKAAIKPHLPKKGKPKKAKNKKKGKKHT